MKNKVITLIIVALLLITPSVIALSSYIYAQNNPVTVSSVSKMEVFDPAGDIKVFKKGDKGSNSAYNSFINMKNGADKVSALVSDSSVYLQYKVKYHSYNKVHEYTYYLTPDPSNNFFRDSKGNLYHISAKNAKKFLKTEFATNLFPDADQPVLTVGRTENVLPFTADWEYLGIDGKFMKVDAETTNVKPVCDVSGGLQLSFSSQPDYVYVVIKNTEGAVVFDNVYEEIDYSLFANNTVYDVKLTAKWYKDETKSNCGELTYQFTANVMSPAVFYMKTYENLTYGDFVVVSAKNVVDPTQIQFESTPSINFTPVFFEYGGYHHALVPISLECEKTNAGALSYTFSFKYGETSQDIDVSLIKRATGKDYQTIPDGKTHLRTDETIAQFNDEVGKYLTADNSEVYWLSDGMVVDPTTRKVRTGFGINVYISGKSYLHEGVNFYVKSGDIVTTCLPGKVVYVGATALSGTTVIVEHGGGLKSLYAHLNSVNVSVDQVIAKGSMIGIVGDTGFCTGTTLHFGLYVNGVPVRYYKYETEGIKFADEVVKNLSK